MLSQIIDLFLVINGITYSNTLIIKGSGNILNYQKLLNEWRAFMTATAILYWIFNVVSLVVSLQSRLKQIPWKKPSNIATATANINRSALVSTFLLL